MRDVRIVGVGMTPFAKSSTSLRSLTTNAVVEALKDSSVPAERIGAAFVANAAAGLMSGQEMIRGQVLLQDTSVSGLPVFNVENACASGSSALHLGWQAVAGGIHEMVLCVGAEKLVHEDRGRAFAAIASAVDVERRAELAARLGTSPADDRSLFMDIYADLAKRYMEHSGATLAHFAQVAVKNQRHGALNPLAQYGGDRTVEEVLASREIVWPLTLLMCSPISDGAAAVVVASDEAAGRYGLAGPRILASVVLSCANNDPSRRVLSDAAAKAYEVSGIGPDDLDCAEVHDATAPAELMAYEDLGFAHPGCGPELIETGVTALGGKLPVNTSGGLLAKGHPIGATGIAQVCEATWQIRGTASKRQVEGAQLALTQNSGGWLGDDYAVAAVHVLQGR